jgi:hypothetical protein
MNTPQENMAPLERLWEERNRTPVLAIRGTIILIVAAVDWDREVLRA